MKRLLNTIKFSHTAFALPFAILAACLAVHGIPAGRDLAWIVAAALGARTAAMAFNRLADLRFDRVNPRTRAWPLSRGEVSPGAVAILLIGGAGVFLFASWSLNSWTRALCVPTLAVLLGYSITKRFTWGCHFALGFALAIAPAGGWIALRPGWDPVWGLLSAGVLFWVAGFDILYACQDVRFDRREGLHSIPARFGIPTALRASCAVHVVCALLFAAAWAAAGLGALAACGTAAAAALLVFQHRWVRASDLSRVNAAFFTANGLLSAVLMSTWLIDMAF
ncbi:MAG: UbiA family prenyltransferase [Planctomycetes bacterium]|nr:UbiA family prenyltransferase [Planctomycetota bacterium]